MRDHQSHFPSPDLSAPVLVTDPQCADPACGL